MRLVRISGAVVLALALTLPVYAERGGHQDKGRDKNSKQSERGKQNDRGNRAERGNRADHGRPAQVEQRNARPERGHERGFEERRAPEGRRAQLPPGQEKRMDWQQHRAREWAHEHQSWKQRGGYRGYFIPRERFAVYFGPRHFFRVNTLPVVIFAGRPRFHYQGFYFTVVDPWPEYWAPNWYETDDVYVDYVNDGYYMYNRRHPGVAIAINISL